jgi:hypothetical protein
MSNKRAFSCCLLALALMPSVASALSFPIPQNGDVVGEVQVIRADRDDTFVDLARPPLRCRIL